MYERFDLVLMNGMFERVSEWAVDGEEVCIRYGVKTKKKKKKKKKIMVIHPPTRNESKCFPPRSP